MEQIAALISKKDELYQRRKAVVPNGLGIFNPSSVQYAHGAIMIDADGKELIDFAGGIGVLNAGHCPPPVVEAIQKQAEKLIHSSFNVAIYEEYLALAEKLVEILPHGDATKVMFLNSGAEAVENAVKIARQATKRQAVIAFSGGFHGRTMMGMTLTSKVNYKAGCGPFAPEVYRIDFPVYRKAVQTISEEAFAEQEIRRLKDFFKTNVRAEDVAAIIIEIVQGEGGFFVAPKSYIQQLRRLCDETGILLIFDEVQSGFGRTGKWAAYEHYNVIPDISTWAKSMGSGVPIAAVMGKAHIMDAAAPSTIGGTYAGNPICCAASLATIQYMQQININELGTKVGNIVRARFEKWQNQFPQIIGEVRGLGAMLAFELVKNGDYLQPDAALTTKIMNTCAERGLVIISAGVNGNVIRILSPLVIEETLLNKGLDILESVIEELA
ncbi:4-aminobutyrate--2-oxoglutarate transaminase [Limnovirga soli]|uniref:4-aminobutyrate--2-oxoglutarate transaminase n=1 Tax=Limnovirga soli TaxID=2656915 RepID=A0A8J8FH49_9BACT|nr:4-aminobutyrate--2-oxoglutarate transaminase [Limnovirga soli]NNV57327.1 4-aminobutyrate--2-oxoglutarate transaminase [Limnovirga soli]